MLTYHWFRQAFWSKNPRAPFIAPTKHLRDEYIRCMAVQVLAVTVSLHPHDVKRAWSANLAQRGAAVHSELGQHFPKGGGPPLPTAGGRLQEREYFGDLQPWRIWKQFVKPS